MQAHPGKTVPARRRGRAEIECKVEVREVEGLEMAHRVVIVGGGFGGLNAARGLKDPRFEVTLLDRRNFHLFQPLLYQVATGGLSPADIASPIRGILKRRTNVRVLLGEAQDLDLRARELIFDGGTLPYETLIVAAGSENHYFGNEAWRDFAPGLKTVEDATEIRKRILYAFEAAELASSAEERAEWLGFVVIGGGPTGVELAGTLGEMARDSLREDFRAVDPRDAKITLVESLPCILPSFPESLSARAQAALSKLGVTVSTETRVTRIGANELDVYRRGRSESIRARTILWAAGVRASPLARVISRRSGIELDRAGRVPVLPDLSLPGHGEVFVLGDMASAATEGGQPLPAVAPVAMQEGRYVAGLLRDRLDGRNSAPFRYRMKGNLATVGRAFAVADLGRLRLSGFTAWLLWIFVHLLYLVGFENRFLVLTQWAWNYATWNRGARLITWPARGEARGTAAPPPRPPAL
jgi:NADH dehydrogenase